MNHDEDNYDIDTGSEHIPPLGMEAHKRRKKGTGSWYASLNIRHYIVKLHQDLYPELAKKMRNNPSEASNIYIYFLATLPLIIKKKLTPEMKKQIMKTYNLMR